MTSLEAEQQLSVTKISEENIAPHNNSSAYMNSGCKNTWIHNSKISALKVLGI